MPANNMDPAVLHCRVICLDYGVYLPAMGIILTEHGQFREARGENITKEGLYRITYQHIQSCNLSNNTMEFQYSFYPLNVSVDKTVLTCGAVPPLSQLPPCWAQSHVTILYTSGYDTMIPETLMTLPSSTTALVATTGTGGTGGCGGGEFDTAVGTPVTVFLPLTAILALALLIAIPIAVFEGVIIAVRRRSPPYNANV